MKKVICDIKDSPHLIKTAAEILYTTFQEQHINAWPTMESAVQEVEACIAGNNICLGMCVDDVLIGWLGLRPMYAITWELHPMVVRTDSQHQGFGTELLHILEEHARQQGIIGIVLGTDDETDRTSLSQEDITASNLYEKMRTITNTNHHPYEFYAKCGYIIVGIIPNANGRNKPDIWMWKDLEHPMPMAKTNRD